MAGSQTLGVGAPAPLTPEQAVSDTCSHRIYILPTRFGLVYFALVAGMLLGSLNYSNNLGLVLGFLLIGQGLVGMIHTWRNLRGIRVSAGRAQAVFAGREASFPLYVGASDDRTHSGISIGARIGGAYLDLAPGGEAEIRLLVQAPRRGVLALGGLRLCTRFPLGLFCAWSHLDFGSSCLVYPRPADRASLHAVEGAGSGRPSGQSPGAEDFLGLRSYRAGDSLRQIDWKALARERGLLAKQFGSGRSERLWADWDAWPGLSVESRLSRLCRGILDAEEAGIAEYGLRLPGREIAPSRGPVHQARCLAALARFGSTP